MLHTKLSGNQSTASGEEIFLKFFLPYMDVAAFLVK